MGIRGANMREKSNVKTQFGKLLQFRGIAIVLFMVLLFVCVVSLGIYTGTENSTDGNIAFAGTSDPVNTNSNQVCTFGTDQVNSITAASLGYPGASGTTSFSTGAMTTSTISFANQSNISYAYKADLIDGVTAPSPSFSASNGTYRLEYDATDNRYEYGWSVVNFDAVSNSIFSKLMTSFCLLICLGMVMPKFQNCIKHRRISKFCEELACTFQRNYCNALWT